MLLADAAQAVRILEHTNQAPLYRHQRKFQSAVHQELNQREANRASQWSLPFCTLQRAVQCALREPEAD